MTARRTPLGGRANNPREVLERFRQASITQSAEAMRHVYAPDAVHEFPFTLPGLPSRLEGRDEIVNRIVSSWAANPLKYDRYVTHAIHDTRTPGTVIIEQEAQGTHPATDPFTLPNITTVTTHNNHITHLRDYVNLPAVATALGHEL